MPSETEPTETTGAPAGDPDPSREEEDSQAAAGAGLVSVSSMLQNIIEILLVVVLTRILDQTTFGLFAFVYMVQVTIKVIGTMGLPDSLLYFVPKLGKEVERSLGLWSGAQLFALALPLSTALWFGGPALADLLGAAGTGLLFRYVAVLLLAEFPAEVLPRLLLAKRSYRSSFVVTILFATARFCSVAIPAALGLPLETIFFWFVGVAWLRFGVYLLVVLALLRGDLRPKGWRQRDLIVFGAPMAASKILGRVNRELDKYMVFIIFTPAVYGVYTVGAQEIPLVNGIAFSVTTALLPTLVLRYDRRDVDGLLGLWHGSMSKVASIMMPVFFCCFVLAEPLMRVIFSEPFERAAIPFRVYLCLLPIRLCGYGIVVRALGRTAPVMHSAIIGLVVNAGLNYPMYLLFGLAGPGVASVLAQVAGILYLLRIIRKDLDVSWRRVFPYAAVFRALAVAGLCAAPVVGLLLVLDDDLTAIAGGSLLYFVIYLIAARKTGVVSRKDLLYLRDLASLKFFTRS